MKMFVRVIITTVVFLASFYFIFWMPCSILIIDENGNFSIILSTLISLICASVISWFTWKKLSVIEYGYFSYALMGGIIIGSISFIFGFFGPMIFMAESNQGPLLGLFITGPIGFLAGLIGGSILWYIKKKNK